MGTYRMYTDGSGDTTWEPVDLNERADWLEGFETTNIRFGLRPPNVVQDWHPAPQRQYVVILSGQLQIRFPDDSTKVFGPGDARLMDNDHRQGPPDDGSRRRAVHHGNGWSEGPNAALARPAGPGARGARARFSRHSRAPTRESTPPVGRALSAARWDGRDAKEEIHTWPSPLAGVAKFGVALECPPPSHNGARTYAFPRGQRVAHPGRAPARRWASWSAASGFLS